MNGSIGEETCVDGEGRTDPSRTDQCEVLVLLRVVSCRVVSCRVAFVRNHVETHDQNKRKHRGRERLLAIGETDEHGWGLDF